VVVVVVQMKQNDRLSRIRQKQRLEGRQHFQNPFYTCAGVLESASNLWLLLLLPSVREKLELTKLLGNSGVRKENDEKEMWIEKKKKKKRKQQPVAAAVQHTVGGRPHGSPYYYCCVCVWVYSNIWSLKKRVESKTRWRFFIFPTERRLVVYLSCTFSLFVWSVGYCQYWIMRPALFTKN
jgi:hypothetical protein